MSEIDKAVVEQNKLKLYIGTSPLIQMYVANSLEIAKRNHKEYVMGFYDHRKSFSDDEFIVKEVKYVEGYKVGIIGLRIYE